MLAIRAAERLRGAPRLGAGELPRSPDEITAEWLTAVMCKDTPGARVETVTRKDGSVGTTTRQSLEVTYNVAAAELPRRLFVKCTSTAAQRLMLGLGGVLAGEPGFYNQIRPRLAIDAPTGYFAGVDSRSWRSVVVIEDVIATRNARFWDPSMRIGREQIERVLSNVAAWHGALWDSSQLDEWSWLKTPAEQMQVIAALIGLADRTRAGAERARAVTPALLHRRQGDLCEAMGRSMAVAGRRPHTYLHGDLHIANTYLTDDGAAGIADWQIGLKGGWAFDYSYLVGTALEVEDRRAWERELLDFYLERLAAAGGPEVQAAEAWQAYRQALFYPYFAWTYTLGRSRLQPQFQPDEVSLTMLERLAAAIADLDGLAAVGL